VPDSLLRYLNDQFNKEIEGGDTYPMMEGMPLEKFSSYWFQNFGAIMLLGNIESADEVVEGKDWSKECLGTFYIKPNYPGRSSHVCNAGFIVTDASRNRGVGRLMGETYLDYAPKLGYTYSVFNLVYETNVASCKIWDALGFKRIGRVKDAGNLKSYPDRLIDAIIYGRDLGDGSGSGSSEELVSEERFDKIKFYLKYGRYPNGADRAEKSRLRSAATHYKLLDGDILMLKDKEVISDPQRQYTIARTVHNQAHAGINKTTATIAERFHWSRIKETVSDVIRNCPECKDLGKTTSAAQSTTPVLGGNAVVNQPRTRANNNSSNLAVSPASGPSSMRSSPTPLASGSGGLHVSRAGARGIPLPEPVSLSEYSLSAHHYRDANDMGAIAPSHTLQTSVDTLVTDHDVLHQQHAATSTLAALSSPHPHIYQPIDPQIISQPSPHMHSHASLDHHQHEPYVFHHHHHHHHTDHDHDPDAHTYQALLNATDDDVDTALSHHAHQHPLHDDDMVSSSHHHRSREEEDAAVERDLEMSDLEMLIEDDDEEEEGRSNELHMDCQNSEHDDIAGVVCEAVKTKKMGLGHLHSSHHEDDDGFGDVGSSPGRMG
jgi:GNAT superfamily N-acetyltransferase